MSAACHLLQTSWTAGEVKNYTQARCCHEVEQFVHHDYNTVQQILRDRGDEGMLKDIPLKLLQDFVDFLDIFKDASEELSQVG